MLLALVSYAAPGWIMLNRQSRRGALLISYASPSLMSLGAPPLSLVDLVKACAPRSARVHNHQK